MLGSNEKTSCIVLLALVFCLCNVVFAQDGANYKELPNFHQVNEKVYRGAQPKGEGLQKLRQLGIKTVINLRDDDERARAEASKAHAAGLRYFNIPLNSFQRPDDKIVAHLLSLISADENQPVFVHCKRGADRTGTLIAVYRIEHDGWTSEKAKAEAKRHGLGFWQIGMKDYIHDYYQSQLKRRPERLKLELQTPSPPEDQLVARDAHAKRQAEAAVELFWLGEVKPFWSMLRQTADNTRRSWLIHNLAQKNADPRALVRQLEIEKDASVRRALILGLGTYSNEHLSAGERHQLTETLLNWYRNDPDSGVHAAIDWLLRPARRAEVARKLDWQGAPELADIDRELAGQPPGKRSWYVTSQGQTMVIIRSPSEFQMGSPNYEVGRTPDESQRRVRIPRSFAIGTKEITVAEFRRFLDANPDIKRTHAYPEAPDRMAQVLQRFSPDDNTPQIALTWYEAAMYCNWLSKQEGIPESEWVYPTDFAEIKDGMELPRDYLHRSGYRLPTEAEWEYAVRAGSTTPRFFGISDALLDEYAWYSKKPLRNKSDPVVPTDPQRTWPVGELKPNDRGLFDVYGNVWEWIQNRWQEYSADLDLHEDLEDEVLKVSDSQARTRRGGSFSYGAEVMRSAHRGSTNYFPNQRRDNVGFRIARTYR